MEGGDFIGDPWSGHDPDEAFQLAADVIGRHIQEDSRNNNEPSRNDGFSTNDCGSEFVGIGVLSSVSDMCFNSLQAGAVGLQTRRADLSVRR